MNVITTVKNSASNRVKKIVATAAGACMAVSMLAMSAFAEGASSVYDTVTTSMTTELTSLVEKAGVAIAGVVGVGLVIFGVKWLVGVLKSFFKKLT